MFYSPLPFSTQNIANYINQLNSKQKKLYSKLYLTQSNILIPRSKTLREMETRNPISLVNTDAKNFNKTIAIYKKDITSWPNGVYLRNAKLIQHLKTNQYNSPGQQKKEEKPYDNLNRDKKKIDNTQHPFFKNSQ